MKKYVLATVALAASIWTGSAVQAQSFEDVPKTHTYYTEIEEMKELQVINGYENRQFRPNQQILRKHVVALIYKSMDLQPIRPATTFADVTAESSYAEMIQAVYRAGIIDGDMKNGQRYFSPDETLTRAQMAKILSLAFQLEHTQEAPFTDVSRDHWSATYIDRLYSYHITTGNNGKFLPSSTVTRQHFAVFMYRAMGEQDQLSYSGQAHYLVKKSVQTGQGFAAGSYDIGEIPVGEYVIVPETAGLMYFSEDLPSGFLVASEIFDTFGYVYVQGIGSIATDGALIPVDLVEQKYTGAKDFYGALQNAKNYNAAGMYKVGADVAVGERLLLSTAQDATVGFYNGPVGKGDLAETVMFTGVYQLQAQQGQYLLITDATVE